MDPEIPVIQIQAGGVVNALKALIQHPKFQSCTLKAFEQRKSKANKNKIVDLARSILTTLSGKSKDGLIELVDSLLSTEDKLKLTPCNQVSHFY